MNSLTARNVVFLSVLILASMGCGSLPGGGAPENRDRHGPRSVETYIQRLQTESRVRELDPEGVIQRLELEPTAVVADIGVGPGIVAIPLARHLTQGLVYAVDVEPRQLDALRERLLAEGIDNVIPVLASYSDPHLPPRGIDWIFIVDTYHHLDDRVAYLRGLRADLSEGGQLAILEFKPGDLPVGPPADHKFSHEQRFGELREAGFEKVQSFDTHRYHDFEVWRPIELVE
ncbi:MAG: class I SAM-dependent methyltransferase [Deltaproteobacteria bacterium]|nr:class I SAM-dependent methyltransferase [Deltaproteobacteria bacterium]MBW2392724.1 class I SAM-dependent methyltransferase [Deltaproteobacteria bacterium]